MNIKSNEPDDIETALTAKQGWYFLYAIILVLVGVDIVNWNGEFAYYNNYHCYIVGFIIYILYGAKSQSIIDKNLFRKYSLIAAIPACVLLIKMLLTTFTVPAFLAISFPIFYLGILRFWLFVFFAEYPHGTNRPIHVSYTRTGVYWEGQEAGYVPTRADKRFSLWTGIGMFVLMAIVIGGAAF
jgi:hypothetical protein